jgi:hypothetical protein
VSGDADPTCSHPLLCVECGREQRDGERGWRAVLTTDKDEPNYEPAEAIIYCPDCAAREFGPSGGPVCRSAAKRRGRSSRDVAS